MGIIAFHVDDSAIFANANHIHQVKNELSSKFNMCDLGELKQFIGITVNCKWQQNSITISQSGYIHEILEWAGMLDCNPTNTQMDPKKHHSPYCNTPPDYPYQIMIRSLMWATLCTCPNIPFTVHHLAQFNSCFGTDHMLLLSGFSVTWKGHWIVGSLIHNPNPV